MPMHTWLLHILVEGIIKSTHKHKHKHNHENICNILKNDTTDMAREMSSELSMIYQGMVNLEGKRKRGHIKKH